MNEITRRRLVELTATFVVGGSLAALPGCGSSAAESYEVTPPPSPTPTAPLTRPSREESMALNPVTSEQALQAFQDTRDAYPDLSTESDAFARRFFEQVKNQVGTH